MILGTRPFPTRCPGAGSIQQESLMLPRAFGEAWRLLLLVMGLVVLPLSASAQDTGQTKTAGGLSVYFGLVPAEILGQHSKDHAEATAHDGPADGEHEYHLIIAIFDATTGVRIEDAKVTARVSSLGLVGPSKTLEPMMIADTVTYGNYFNLPGEGTYRIDVEIERPQGLVKMTFDVRH